MKKEKAPKKRLKLEDLIYQVKSELLEAQQKHAGEKAFLELDTIEMEVKVATTVSGKGTVDVWVLKFGELGGGRENTHTVRLSFKVAKPKPLPASTATKQLPPFSLQKEKIDDLTVIQEFQLESPSLGAVTPHGPNFGIYLPCETETDRKNIYEYLQLQMREHSLPVSNLKILPVEAPTKLSGDDIKNP